MKSKAKDSAKGSTSQSTHNNGTSKDAASSDAHDAQENGGLSPIDINTMDMKIELLEHPKKSMLKDGKMTTLNLFSCARPHMRAFHLGKHLSSAAAAKHVCSFTQGAPRKVTASCGSSRLHAGMQLQKKIFPAPLFAHTRIPARSHRHAVVGHCAETVHATNSLWFFRHAIGGLLICARCSTT
jgi:hypothetical protein